MKVRALVSRSPRVAAIFALTLALLSLVLRPAHATLVSVDDAVYGAGSFTLDTNTNLEWLDLTQTNGQSYNDVSKQFGPGGEYAGMRYASSAEVYTLFLDAGIPVSVINAGSTIQAIAAYSTIAALENLVGATIPGYSIGITSDVDVLPSAGPERVVAELYTQILGGHDAYAYTDLASTDSPPDDEKYGGNGSWLVRPAPTTPLLVPEPPTAVIPLAALLMLAWLRLRNPRRG